MSMTSLIYWCIFMFMVNNQEKSVIVREPKEKNECRSHLLVDFGNAGDKYATGVPKIKKAQPRWETPQPD